MLAPRALLSTTAFLALSLLRPGNAQTAAPQSTTTPEIPSAVSECHPHLATTYCMNGENEWPISFAGPSPTGELPAQYTGCHAHAPEEVFCFAPDGSEIQLLIEGASGGESSEHSGEHGEEPEAGSEGVHCHDHAGIPHCVGGSTEVSCEKPDRDYNIPLRVGLLFVILVTSGFGVFAPILIAKFNVPMKNSILLVVKQFGTGVIISTAFVHLFTHADLMFGNQCLGRLEYEGTTAAIVMAGIFLSFLVDYISHRIVYWRQSKTTDRSSESPSHDSDTNAGVKGASENVTAAAAHGHLHAGPNSDTLTVASLEAGILFHSILIGITLVVASDGYFLTLFAVILFHQMFEGLALGSMIAQIPNSVIAMWKKILMAMAFTLITPIGMAIGIGVLGSFNGNDRSTIIAIGTLDALSAGILIWVGLVEMLAKDWMEGDLIHAGMVKTFCAGLSLLAGWIVMSVLGKWA